jgi:hypothetical protein
MSDVISKFITDMTTLDKDKVREFIAECEMQISESDLPTAEIPVKHHWSKGVYAREISIPKDSLVVGKIHKHENLNILSSGEMLLASVDGVKHIKAPYTVVSSPGVKRLALALTDCVWTTIHGTNETDLDIIEEEFIAKTYDEVPKIKNTFLVEGD